MTQIAATVVIIDDDEASCCSIAGLVRSVGLMVQVFGTAMQFLLGRRPEPPACIVLEVRLPEMSGLDLQRELAETGNGMPLIFVTGHGDIPMAVQAMKAGAVDFLNKPFREQDLLDDIREAFQRDQATCEQQRHLSGLRERYELLTSTEREVMRCVVAGLLNKQTAAELGITEKTVKFHRGHVMRKMQAASVVDLALKAEQLCLLSSTMTTVTSSDICRNYGVAGWSGAAGPARRTLKASTISSTPKASAKAPIHQIKTKAPAAG